MRIYIDIAHPAHAHALRFFIGEMGVRGHEILVSARDKDITHCLLRAWGIPFVNRGKGSSLHSGRKKRVPRSGFGIWWRDLFSLKGKVKDLFRVVARLLPVVRKFRPDLVVSYSSYQAAFIGRLLGKPVITFEDTENVPVLHRVNRLLSSRMVTPACFEGEFGRKHIRFEGYKELASLHPSRFKPLPLPPTVEEPRIILRFVSWRAWHDRGHPGIGEEMKITVAQRLSEFGRVYISSENSLCGQLKRYGMPVGCELGHSMLAGARLFLGESASMAAEAAVLGVPAIYIDNTGRGYTRELEVKHGLVYNFGEDDSQVQLALDRAVELLQKPGLHDEWQQKRRQMLEGMTDVTGWMVEMAENISRGKMPSGRGGGSLNY